MSITEYVNKIGKYNWIYIKLILIKKNDCTDDNVKTLTLLSTLRRWEKRE